MLHGCPYIIVLFQRQENMNNNIVQLHSACSDGNVSRVQFLLASGLDPNAQDGDGWSPLMEAAGRGQEGVVELLLGQPNINLEARSNHGNTALIQAAAGGHLSLGVVQLLLHHGAAPAAVSNIGMSVLDWAAWVVSRGGGEWRERARKVIRYLVEEAGMPVSDRALGYVAGDAGSLATCRDARATGPSSLKTLARRAAWRVPGPAREESEVWRSRILRNFVQEQEPQPTIGQ